MKKAEDLYSVLHEHFCTDRYSLGATVVKAKSKRDAMNKLNRYLETKPDGAYTSLRCKTIKNVSLLKYLE